VRLGIASFTSLDALRRWCGANELSRAVRWKSPSLADTVPGGRCGARPGRDVRGSRSPKERLIEAYNDAMLAVSDAVVDTQAIYRDEVARSGT